MSNQIYRINNYKFSSNDPVLFDANVWLFIYSRQGDNFPRNRAAYNLALRRIRSVKGKIFIDALVLSEFINASARFVYSQLPPETKSTGFKAFRDSPDFQPIARKIATQSRKMLEKCELTETGMTAVNLPEIVGQYAAGGYDFNDQMLAQLCKRKGLKLVTHDGDFKGDDLTMITANSRLLG